MEESLKEENLDKVLWDEKESDRDQRASLASCSTARPMIRERKVSTGVGAASTCFKNIWRFSCRSLRDMLFNSFHSSKDKGLARFFVWFWLEFILLLSREWWGSSCLFVVLSIDLCSFIFPSEFQILMDFDGRIEARWGTCMLRLVQLGIFSTAHWTSGGVLFFRLHIYPYLYPYIFTYTQYDRTFESSVASSGPITYRG
jgi:hypothetical protein